MARLPMPAREGAGHASQIVLTEILRDRNRSSCQHRGVCDAEPRAQQNRSAILPSFESKRKRHQQPVIASIVILETCRSVVRSLLLLLHFVYQALSLAGFIRRGRNMLCPRLAGNVSKRIRTLGVLAPQGDTETENPHCSGRDFAC